MVYELTHSDGTITTRKRMSLEQMQEFVEGYIEYSGDHIVNEEGLLKNLPVNKVYPEFVGNVIFIRR
jgi:hypothetical protein